ncbi:MAG: hypothetical protein QOJ98_2792 [Acidobacteriota bacterium]|nr:hypothetical protein [Acidobacteriota bacterium]
MIDAAESPMQRVREQIDEEDVDGNLKLRLCADILAFLPGPFRDHAPGVLRFYQTALTLIGDHVRYYLFDGEGRFKKVKADTLRALPDWAEGRVAERNVYGLDLESGTAPDEQSDRAFQMRIADAGTGFVRLILPAESLLDADRFVAVARDCLDGLRFTSAYAGYAVNVRRTYNTQREGSRIAMISRRFPGVDLDSPLSIARFLADSLKCVNWLTGIGAPLLERAPDLETTLPPSAAVIKLQHGILVRASAAASTGDSNRRDDLPDYAAVGRVLTPLRIPVQRLGPWDAVGGTENTRRWLARFDAK